MHPLQILKRLNDEAVQRELMAKKNQKHQIVVLVITVGTVPCDTAPQEQTTEQERQA